MVYITYAAVRDEGEFWILEYVQDITELVEIEGKSRCECLNKILK